MPINVTLCGIEGVGKSQLMRRLAGKPFTEDRTGTIGVDSEKNGKYHFMEPSRVSRFKAFTSNTYLQTDVILLCFNSGDRNSFDELKNVITSLENRTKDDCKYILVETCTDQLADSQVPVQGIAEFMDLYQIQHHVRTSAKTDEGIEELKTTMDGMFAKKEEQKQIENPSPQSRKSLNPRQQTTPRTSPNPGSKTMARTSPNSGLKTTARTSSTPTKRKTRPELKLESEPGSDNYSFMFNALIATAAVSALGLCIAALVTMFVLSSTLIPACLLGGGIFLGAGALGTFFYRWSQSANKPLREENSPPSPLT